MRPFAFETVDTIDAALMAARQTASESVARQPGSGNTVQFLAGGTTLVDLMKLDVMRPTLVVDLNALQRSELGRIEKSPEGLRLGALVRMAEAAEDQQIKRDFPALAQSLNLAASPQIRNMASLGGNVLQRTRCTYFRDVSYQECNKRNPGSGCAAIDGFNRAHAVLGTSDACIATYPGDFAQALIAFDSTVEVAGPRGRRTIPFSSLHRLPEKTPDVETTLQSGEMILWFTVPSGPWTRRSAFLKVRDRESYEFALASAVVGLDLEDQYVRSARIALGGVAAVPWRAQEAEALLVGKILTEEMLEGAAEAAFADAKVLDDNAFKVELGKRTLIRALEQAAEMEI